MSNTDGLLLFVIAQGIYHLGWFMGRARRGPFLGPDTPKAPPNDTLPRAEDQP